MKFNIQQEDGILKYATEEEVKVSLNVPDDSNLKVVRTESRGSATYDFNLTELTSNESSSQFNIGFYDTTTNSYFASAPIVTLYKNDSPNLNYLEVLVGDETVGTNLIKITPSETRLGNQVVYQNPNWELVDNTIPHWKAVTDYIDASNTPSSLQTVTEIGSTSDKALFITGNTVVGTTAGVTGLRFVGAGAFKAIDNILANGTLNSQISLRNDSLIFYQKGSIMANETRIALQDNGRIWLNAQSRVEVTGGDLEIITVTKGVIIKSPDASRWRITIDDQGVLTTTKL